VEWIRLSLLDRIAKCLDIFISDLHFKEYYKSAYSVINRIPASEYEVGEWITAYRYITGEESNLRNSVDVKNSILEFLKGEKEKV